MTNLWPTVVGLLAVILYAERLNGAVGLMVDDAWYVLLAKSLAEGSGYRLISSAATPILPSYPPGWPALLSLVFRINPAFPDNVWLLKSVSVAAMVGVGLLTYLYLHRYRRLTNEIALCAAIAVVITPAFVFLATSTVMSECVFTFGQLATVLVLHQSASASTERSGVKFAIMGGVLAAATIMVRSAGVALIIAAVLWLIKERLWRRAAAAGGVAVLCALPWTLYARANTPTATERVAHGGAVVYDYVDQLSMRWAGSPSFGRISPADLPARIATNVVDVFGRDLAGIMVPMLLRGATESGEEVVALGGTAGLSSGSMGGAIETMIVSFMFGGVMLLGYIRLARERVTIAEMLVPISLAITLLWPFWSFRFVLPLTPFLYLYFIAGIQGFARGSVRAVPLVLLCLVGLHAYDHAGYLLHAHSGDRPSRIQWLADDEKADAALRWMQHGLEEPAMLATTNPALVFLRTGRKSIAFDDPATDRRGLRARGVRYIASFVPVDLPHRDQGDYKVRFLSGRLWVIELQ